MKVTEENVLKLLEYKEKEQIHGKSEEYTDGYIDAIKELKFIISVVWK